MNPLIETIPTWFGLGAGGGAGFLLARWFVEYIGGRMDRRADALDKGTQRLMEQLEKRVAQLEARLEKAESDLAECNRKHAQSDAEVMRLKAVMQGYGDARNKVQVTEAAQIVPARRRVVK